MIQKIQAYKSSDGTAHSTLDEAQKHELRPIVESAITNSTISCTFDQCSELLAHLMRDADKIIDILTMKPNSLPKARRINGGTKKRQPKHIAEQFAMPLGETPAKATA